MGSIGADNTSLHKLAANRGLTSSFISPILDLTTVKTATDVEAKSSSSSNSTHRVAFLNTHNVSESLKFILLSNWPLCISIGILAPLL
jgi:hypothetical protein